MSKHTRLSLLLVVLCSALSFADYLPMGGGGGGGGGPAPTPQPTATPQATPTPLTFGTTNTLVKFAATQLGSSGLSDDGAGNLQLYPNSATPQALTETISSCRGGTDTNCAGVTWTLNGSLSTGTGLGGSFAFALANLGSTGTAANTRGNVLTLSPPNTGTTAPVNYLDIKSAIAGGTPTISAVGTDSNITISFTPKGTGSSLFNGTLAHFGGAALGNGVLGLNPGGAGSAYACNTCQIGFAVGAVTTTFVSPDTILTRVAAANFRFGAADSATPVAQTLSIQGGTGTNIAGQNWTVKGSQSTGTGLGGSIIFQVSNLTTTGTTANTFGNVLSLSPPNTGTTAPVNYLDLKNGITGGNPGFTATGTDTNIGLFLTTKGSGQIALNALTVQAIQIYSAGANGNATGQLDLSGVTSGKVTIKPQAAAGTYEFDLPTTAGTAGQVLTSQAGGGTAMTWTAPQFEVSAGSGTFGNNTNFPTNTVIATWKAASAGHFTQLNCVNSTLAAGSCTTAPTVNVFDGTTNTGTALTCSTTVQTKGNQSTQAQTQTFAAGDIIGIYVSTAGATCTAPVFNVTATATTP